MRKEQWEEGKVKKISRRGAEAQRKKGRSEEFLPLP
jgi:hypothetical protein